jgi:predicted GH43/DUF377 family glycosyl hydrolase
MRRIIVKGIAASFAGMLLMACSGCGGGGGSSSTPTANAPLVAQSAPSLNVISVESNPVMTVGAAGSWDSDDVLNPSVIEWNGKLLDYYSGFDGNKWSTGLATSTDGGLTWTKSPIPLIVPTVYPASVDPYFAIAANGGAVLFNGTIYNYYSEQQPDRSGLLRLATSTDGVSFAPTSTYFGFGSAGSFDDAGAADAYLTVANGTMYMYYEGLNSTTKKQTTGVATSTDGKTWTRYKSAVIPQGAQNDFDEGAQGEPAVVYTGKFWYMLIVGTRNDGSRSIGWASSTDGLHWTLQAQSILTPDQVKPWFDKSMIDPTILPTGKNDGTYYVWFGGGSGAGNQKIAGQIGRMTIKLD